MSLWPETSSKKSYVEIAVVRHVTGALLEAPPKTSTSRVCDVSWTSSSPAISISPVSEDVSGEALIFK